MTAKINLTSSYTKLHNFIKTGRRTQTLPRIPQLAGDQSDRPDHHTAHVGDCRPGFRRSQRTPAESTMASGNAGAK